VGFLVSMFGFGLAVFAEMSFWGWNEFWFRWPGKFNFG